MSAVPKYAAQEQALIGRIAAGAIAAPAVRPAPRHRRHLGGALAVCSVWLVLMALCFLLVQKHAAIRTANADIAHIKGEITALEQRNMELDGKVANAVSVAQVEAWAKTHGMKPPTGIVRTLNGKPEAVALRNGPAPDPTPVAADQAPAGLWHSFIARLTGSITQAAGAKQ